MTCSRRGHISRSDVLRGSALRFICLPHRAGSSSPTVRMRYSLTPVAGVRFWWNLTAVNIPGGRSARSSDTGGVWASGSRCGCSPQMRRQRRCRCCRVSGCSDYEPGTRDDDRSRARNPARTCPGGLCDHGAARNVEPCVSGNRGAGGHCAVEGRARACLESAAAGDLGACRNCIPAPAARILASHGSCLSSQCPGNRTFPAAWRVLFPAASGAAVPGASARAGRAWRSRCIRPFMAGTGG